MKTLPMKTLALSLLLGFGALGPVALAQTAPAALAATPKPAPIEAVVDRVQKAYENITSLRAKVVQTSRLSSLAKDEVQKGIIVLAKPGRMRWEFSEPQERLFISDGKTLFVYTKAENQVISQPIAGQTGVGIDFLLGLGDIRKQFEVSAVEEKEYVRPGRDLLGLKPKQAAGSIARMIFSVDAATGLVRELWTFDPMGNRTHLAFTDIEVNPAVDAVQFTFTPPAGAEVLQAGGF